MKKRSQLTEISLIGLYILFGIPGAVLAVLIYFKYAYIARGVVGLATIFLFINQTRLNNHGVPLHILLQRQDKISDFINVFVGTLILTWAGLQILQVYLHYVLGK